jgi:hypothetical protein
MSPFRRIAMGLWWWFRGVSYDDYRQLCKRCGRTGQAHWSARGCIRFKLKR